MRLRLLEVSNSFTKQALCEEGRFRELTTHPTPDLNEASLAQLLAHDADGIVFSSVVPGITRQIQQLALPHILQIEAGIALGYDFDYPHPGEIGADRLANAIALSAYHSLPAIALDLGTALTLEVVDGGRRFLGGCIAAGPELLFRSLSTGTAQLPSVHDGGWSLPAKSTVEAIRAGCLAPFAAVVDALIDRSLTSLDWSAESVSLVVTGGHSIAYLAESRHKPIHDPHLTLRGLWRAGELNAHSFVFS